MISGIIELPAKGHLKERYVTTGKDGTFRFWQAKVLPPGLVNACCKAVDDGLLTVCCPGHNMISGQPCKAVLCLACLELVW